MASSDVDVKRAAELKLRIEGRIAQLRDEIDMLSETLNYVDATLRATTFKPAIEMMAEAKEPSEARELKRDRGGQVIANASISADTVTVEPTGVTLKSETPPFRSFLIGKILQGMKAKDEELAASGKIQKGSELRYDVEESNGVISKLVVENYRDKARLNEILNTVSWTFSRMLEK